MRWARFDQNGTPSYAVVEDNTVIPVLGSPFENWERTSRRLKLDEVKLLAPVIPPTFYAAGMNYAEHVREVAEKIGQKPNFPTQPDIGYRANNALIAHGETIVIPADATDQVQYEGELVVVIGRKCKHLTRDNALSAVLGYTIGNDVSERTWQKSDRTMWRAKNTDTFKPMGPWIETELKLDDLVTRDPFERRTAHRVPYQSHDFRCGRLSRGDDLVPDSVSGRHDVDGHRGRHRKHEARRPGRSGDQRHRHPQQQSGAGGNVVARTTAVIVRSDGSIHFSMPRANRLHYLREFFYAPQLA